MRALRGASCLQEEEETITYADLAKHFPDIKLAELLHAEATFAEADADGNGTIDVTGESPPPLAWHPPRPQFVL
jgi:hypothetical protein